MRIKANEGVNIVSASSCTCTQLDRKFIDTFYVNAGTSYIHTWMHDGFIHKNRLQRDTSIFTRRSYFYCSHFNNCSDEIHFECTNREPDLIKINYCEISTPNQRGQITAVNSIPAPSIVHKYFNSCNDTELRLHKFTPNEHNFYLCNFVKRIKTVVHQTHNKCTWIHNKRGQFTCNRRKWNAHVNHVNYLQILICCAVPA